MPEVSE
jgi:hypothetical protein